MSYIVANYTTSKNFLKYFSLRFTFDITCNWSNKICCIKVAIDNLKKTLVTENTIILDLGKISL